MTMSISRAPAATLARISSIRCCSGLRPAGKPAETAATGIVLPARASTAVGTSAWYTQTAPTRIPSSDTPRLRSRSSRSGRRAFAHSRRTLPGVSSPASVVRSMSVIARSNQAACHSFLTVRRVGMVAARRSTALRFTWICRIASRSNGIPGLRSLPCTGRGIPAVPATRVGRGSTARASLGGNGAGLGLLAVVAIVSRLRFALIAR